MKRILLFFLTIAIPLISQERDFQKEARDLAKKGADKLFKSIVNYKKTDDMLPESDKGEYVDPDQLRKNVLNGKSATNEISQFLEDNPAKDSHISENESFLSDVTSQKSSGLGEYVEVCQESSKNFEFYLTRTLNYTVSKENIQEEISNLKCLGHKITEKVTRGTGKSEASRKEKELASSSQIKSFRVTYKDVGILHRDLVIVNFKHVDNCQSCNKKKHETQFIQKNSNNIDNESWSYRNESLKKLAEDPYSSLTSNTCIDDSVRVIDGKEYSRCWVEKLSFLYHPPKVSGCEFLKSQFCKLKSSRCLKEGPIGCILWERTFSCYKKLQKKKVPAEYWDSGANNLEWETQYEPNNSFSDIAMKFEVFNQMDKDLKSASPMDIKNFRFFSGRKQRCFIHSLNNIAYDCCEKMGGLSVDGLISQCDEDELALFDQRARGLCVYIGEKDIKKVGFTTSKKKVFCCFSSKLARVFNEQARGQLGISWGDAEDPRCEGLNQNHIKQVNFTEIDLSEACDAPPEGFKERMERVRSKIISGLEK